MSGSNRMRIILEIDVGSEPIRGRLTDDRETRAFSGWLQLAADIQAALDPAPSQALNDEPSLGGGTEP